MNASEPPRPDETEGRAVVNGRPLPLSQAALPFSDDGVSRGDGALETIGVWDGVPFRLDDHLGRLAASLDALGLPAPPTDRLRSEALGILEGLGPVDAALRLYVTASGSRVVTLTPPPTRPPLRSLRSQPAPWVRPLGTYGAAAAKTMSFALNMAASRAARRAGGDDALLVALEGYVLEGPTFSILWVAGGVLRTPALSLGIVDSISRRTLVELAGQQGIRTAEGRWMPADLGAADEVMACSSIRGLEAVAEVDQYRFDGPTPVRDLLAGLLDEARRGR